MNILLLGSGGREHALAWKLSQSAKLGQLYILPGNAGTAGCGENIEGSVNDFEKIRQVVLEKGVSMVVVGPEEPLVKGIHDFFLNDPELAAVSVIGPRMLGARLEGSKDFSKNFMLRHGIPTASYATFTPDTLQEAYQYIRTHSLPIVLKADGLAAGKGVIITSDRGEATNTIREMLSGAAFGDAGTRVVIEEFLTGIELSVFVLTDGISYKVLPEAKDYKRIGVGDTGLNTGGMGSISPVPFATAGFMAKITDRIILPTLEGLKKEGIPYTGFIFIGIIKVGDEPFVIEYNVRLGDPETESVIPRITSDLLELFQAVASQTLDQVELTVSEQAAATIMLVSGGYPGKYNKGLPINGYSPFDSGNTFVFHAGTRLSGDSVVTDGGRVIAVTALAANAEKALARALDRVEDVDFIGLNYRNDIGFDLKNLA